MLKYVIGRILMMVLVLFGVLVAVFSINYISPGDPVDLIVGSEASFETKETVRSELGLDQPYIVQLWNYAKGFFTKLDLGTSYKTKTNVRDDILIRFPTTLKLSLLAVTIATLIGIPLGIISATKHNTIFDYVATFLALIGASVPGFWLGLMLMIVFAVNLGWLPASGLESWKHWILPTFALSIYPIATITRTTRASMLEVVRQDYIRTARSKGISEGKVIRRHALGNALIPVVTVVGMQLGFVLGGVMVMEAVFSIPGIGSLLKTAIGYKDNPTILGCVLFASFMMCFVNLLVDILYAFIDPRIKAQYAGRPRKDN